MTHKHSLSPDTAAFRQVSLREGEQALINGALVTAIGDSTFFVNASASVIASRPPRVRESGAKPAHELYYAALGAAGSDISLAHGRQNLLDLLADTVAHHRTRAAQELCSSFAVGLDSGDVDIMLTAARKLAECEARGVRAAVPVSRAA
jgi:flagellar protein FlbT